MINLTISDWVVIIIIGIAVIAFISMIAIAVFNIDEDDKKAPIVVVIITFIYFMIAINGFNWYNTNTANGQRHYKDFESNINGGLNREITITAEDGREIFHYEGKVDIESNHTDNYIKFESEDGKRYIVYYGIQDTITIIEK